MKRTIVHLLFYIFAACQTANATIINYNQADLSLITSFEVNIRGSLESIELTRENWWHISDEDYLSSILGLSLDTTLGKITYTENVFEIINGERIFKETRFIDRGDFEWVKVNNVNIPIPEPSSDYLLLLGLLIMLVSNYLIVQKKRNFHTL